jgi:glycosyltransferase involved in cell wall biosynthesis
MSSPLVSVIIPAHQAAEFLADAVASALAQHHTAVEVIVVDDGSTDGGATALEPDPRVTVLRQSHEGVSAARNRGIAAARGDLIAFLDADDAWYPGKLARQVSALGASPETVGVGCLMHYLGRNRRALGVRGKVLTESVREDLRHARDMPIALSSLVVRAHALERAGRFLEGLDQGEDVDLLARLSRVGRIDVLPDVLGVYRLHHASASATSLQLQRAARQWLHQRHAGEEVACTPSWVEFLSNYRPSRAERMRGLGAEYYRRAGMGFVDGRILFGARNLIAATAVAPTYVYGKARLQLPYLRDVLDRRRFG